MRIKMMSKFRRKIATTKIMNILKMEAPIQNINSFIHFSNQKQLRRNWLALVSLNLLSSWLRCPLEEMTSQITICWAIPLMGIIKATQKIIKRAEFKLTWLEWGRIRFFLKRRKEGLIIEVLHSKFHKMVLLIQQQPQFKIHQSYLKLSSVNKSLPQPLLIILIQLRPRARPRIRKRRMGRCKALHHILERNMRWSLHLILQQQLTKPNKSHNLLSPINSLR